VGRARGGVDCSSGDEGQFFIASLYCRENPSCECRLSLLSGYLSKRISWLTFSVNSASASGG
jgi:hypothetical protein